MDEKKVLKLKVMEKTDLMLEKPSGSEVKQKLSGGISHPNQTNPIYKKMAKFSNSKLSESELGSWSVNNLLR